MIQFNKTFLQLTKRLALVVILMSLANAAWASNTYYYSRVKAEVTIDGQASAEKLVYVSETAITDDTPDWNEASKEVLPDGTDDDDKLNEVTGIKTLSESATEKYQDGAQKFDITNFADGGKSVNMSHSYYLYAKEDARYLFAGWYQGDNVLTTEYAYTVPAITPTKAITGNVTTDYRVYKKYVLTFNETNYYDLVATAKYLVPAVVSVEGQLKEVYSYTKNITHDNPAETTITVPVEFGVQSALEKANFTLKIEGTTIASTETYWTYADNKVTVNVSVPLTSDATQVTKTVTLTSNYKGSADKAQTYTCIINVTKDYVPRFHVAKDAKVFYSNNETSAENEFIATLLNPTAELATWTTTITGEDASNFTFVSNSDNPDGTSENTPNPRIKFSYTGEQQNSYAAELHIYCTYNNVKSQILAADGTVMKNNGTIVEEKIIYLSARFDPIIVFDGEQNRVHTFATQTATAVDDKYTENVAYRHNLSEDPKAGTITYNPESNNCISFATLPAGQNGNVAVTVNRNANPGDYSATLPVTGTTDNGTISASLTAKVRIELATPSLNATPGDNSVVFSWAAVPHANKYVITRVTATGAKWADADLVGQTYATSLFTGGTNIQEADATATSINGLNVANNTTYYYCITALYLDGNNKIIDSKTSSVIHFMPSNTPLTITLPTAKLAMYTGTADSHADDESAFPLRKLRQIDVSAAFDNNGNALMDYIYIFEKTLNGTNEVTSITALTSDIKTPCHIYAKLNATTYQYISTIENLNAESKDSRLTISAGNGTKYYFTGYCPFASTGNTYDQQGVIQIIGAGNVDIYLDNLQVYARDKGDASFELNINTLSVFGEANSDGNYLSYPLGSGAVFAFTATSQTFKPTIHIRGNNILDATEGLKIKAGSEITFNHAVPTAGFAQYSAPIQIVPTFSGSNTDTNYGTSNKTELTIDDVWPAVDGTIRTNGTLSLQEHKGGTGSGWTEANTAPSIDFGLPNSKLTLAGGQIFMNNATLNSSIMATARLQSSLTVTVTVSDKSESFTTTFYGIACSSEKYLVDNTVCITDGTMNSGDDTTLKLPTSTTIDGGTFNCTIQAGDATTIKNSYGTELTKFSVDVTKYDNTNTNGTANTTQFNQMLDDLFPHAGMNDEQNYHRSLSMYYVDDKSYGHSSLCPDGNNIYLMLPALPTDGIHLAWQICSPNFMANINNNSRELGGGIPNINSCGVSGHAPYSIDYMLYMEMDEYTRQAVQETHNVVFNDDYQAQVTVSDDQLYTTVDNQASYEINKKVYMLKPVVAGEWTMFVAPFDVCNVYVIEAYPENQIRKDYGKSLGYGDYLVESHNIPTARKEQAKRLLDLYTFWYLAEKDMDAASDFFGTGTADENGTVDEYGIFVDTWIAYESSRGKGGATPAEGSDYTPIVEQLYHFTGYDGTYPDGTYWWDAHYYLYKSPDNTWEYDAANEKVLTDWTQVTTQSTPRGNTVIMERGGIYTMQFPATIGTTVNDWNYWTGKYILLEGIAESENAPIEINGSNTAYPTITTPAENGVNISGNASFAEVTVSKDNYLFQLNKNANNVYNFDRATADITLKPTYGFMSANIPIQTTTETNEQGQTVETRKLVKSISMETGDVIYEVSTEVIDNNQGIGSGVPTIMGDLSLIVEPTVEGLCITPVKEQQVMLFDAGGKMIFSKYLTAEENVTLPTGVYVVRGEYEQVKAIKK